jgi:hypothetical protein
MTLYCQTHMVQTMMETMIQMMMMRVMAEVVMVVVRVVVVIKILVVILIAMVDHQTMILRMTTLTMTNDNADAPNLAAAINTLAKSIRHPSQSKTKACEPDTFNGQHPK